MGLFPQGVEPISVKIRKPDPETGTRTMLAYGRYRNQRKAFRATCDSLSECHEVLHNMFAVWVEAIRARERITE